MQSSNPTAIEFSKVLRAIGDPASAKNLQRYFKTGPGEYAEGDRFLGIRVPVLRKEAQKFSHMPLREVRKLLASPWHEERLGALLILVEQFTRGGEAEKKAIYELYLENTRYINNWDLVDASAYKIVGPYLEDSRRYELYRLVVSKNLWERRISIIATYHFIKADDFVDTLRLSHQLLRDEEDLIHKAVGWMLREIGKRNLRTEERFLREHYYQMPRTMLRYAIEKFPPDLRRAYLKGRV
jgi:3-methyladenine DNA glycosylase AlkD